MDNGYKDFKLTVFFNNKLSLFIIISKCTISKLKHPPSRCNLHVNMLLTMHSKFYLRHSLFKNNFLYSIIHLIYEILYIVHILKLLCIVCKTHKVFLSYFITNLTNNYLWYIHP